MSFEDWISTAFKNHWSIHDTDLSCKSACLKEMESEVSGTRPRFIVKELDSVVYGSFDLKKPIMHLHG